MWMYLHCKEPSNCGTKVIKKEAIGQSEEVVHKRGNGENKRVLFILCTAVCRG